jgi:hypothetical protein
MRDRAEGRFIRDHPLDQAEARSSFQFNEKEKSMKPLKLKCVLYTDDGEIWICIRQFYASDLVTNVIVEDQFAGMKLKRIDKMEETNVNNINRTGQV